MYPATVRAVLSMIIVLFIVSMTTYLHCEPEFGQEDMAAEIIRDGDEPCIFARLDVILKWVKENHGRQVGKRGEWNSG